MSIVLGPATAIWNECQIAFAALGEVSIPTLIEMLAETGESNDYRGGAANALGRIGSERALDALLEATATAPEDVANNACNAAIGIGAEDLTARLIAILERGSTQDGRIALYLQRHPTKAALAAIDTALARADRDTHPIEGFALSDSDVRWLKEARALCADAK